VQVAGPRLTTIYSLKPGQSILDDPVVQAHSWLKGYEGGRGAVEVPAAH
jgi:hypothetical protein